MPPYTDIINDLSALLETDAPRPLTAQEQSLLRAALARLASAEQLLALQDAILDSYEHDQRAINTAAAGALERLGALVGAPPPARGFDFAAAHNARNQLLAALRDASRAGQVISAILRFVAISAGFAL